MKSVYSFRFHRDDFEKLTDAPTDLIDKASNDLVVVIKVTGSQIDRLDRVVSWAALHPKIMVMSAYVQHVFSKQEIDAAEWLYIAYVTAAPYELHGEDGATKYDKFGRCGEQEMVVQASDLCFDFRRLNRGNDIQQLITNEIVVSKRVVTLLHSMPSLNGCILRPIYRPKKITRNGDWSEIVDAERVLSEDWMQLEPDRAQVANVSEGMRFGFP